jgi:hypothetical protein
MQKNAIVGLLAMGMGGLAEAQSANDGTDIDHIVKSVMDDTYDAAGFDSKNACWEYTWKNDQGDSTAYCMRPGKPQVANGPRGKVLYLPTYSVADLPGDTTYRYAHVQPGLMGAFQIRLGGAQGWTYQAFDAGTDYGSAGDCGCVNPRFVKLSNQGDYGWIFTSGGTWGGVSVAAYNIVTTIKGRIVDISTIPQVTEEAQGVTYTVSVKEDPTARGFYPLHVEKKTAAGSDTFDVPFDVAKAVYVLPPGY